MRIVFYAARSGLGNNGGTRTLLLSAKTLRELGHDVRIVATVDQFTYFVHPKCIDRIPHNTDVVIAASWWDVEPMHKAWGGSCAWWMRMWDTHRITEDEIYRLANVQPMFVNAEFMKRHLSCVGIESTLMYQGIDFDKWYPAEVDHKQLIGSVIRRQPHYNSGDFLLLAGVLTNRGAVGIEQGTTEELRAFYQGLNYYHAPQTLGGLSNPPMEAALCGACVVCPRIDVSGLGDYANDETAVMYDRLESVPGLILGTDNSGKVSAMQKVIHGKIKSRRENMTIFAKALAKLM